MKNLDQLFKSFETGIRNSKATKPQEYLKSIGLDYTDIRIGFNSGQFHHREEQEVKDHYQSLGLLTPSNAAVRTDEMTAYTVFGRYGLIFPLMDELGQVVNYFTVRFDMANPIEDYLNPNGLYPSCPNRSTKRLFIVPTVMDAASLLQSKALDHREAVLALHDGKLLPQHEKAIATLSELEEIIIIKR